MRRFRKMLKQMEVAPFGGAVMDHPYGLLELGTRAPLILAVVHIRCQIE